MLRFLLILLLAANGLFFAWSAGYLKQFGFASAAKNESFRLADQIEPERVVIKNDEAKKDEAKKDEVTPMASAATAPSVPSPTPVQTAAETTSTKTSDSTSTTTSNSTSDATTCLTAGAFNDRQSTLLKQTLNTKLPDLRWRFDAVSMPARWIVYMGKYPNDNAREIKKKQLDQIKVRYEDLTEGNLEPGLSLGNHASQAAANQSLQQLVKQGVRTARVLQESPEQKAQTLVVPAIDTANRAKLDTLYATIAGQLANKALQICK